MDKTAPVLQSQNATNCNLPTSKVQARASATNDCKSGIPVANDNSASTYKDIGPAKQKANYLVKGRVSALCFQPNKKKKKKKVVVHKERIQRLTINKKKKHQFRQKSQTANYAEFPKEGCLV